jgi:putative glutamine amidotransferase
LDQRWLAFLRYCGLTPLPVPNDRATASRIVDGVPIVGVLLTGGNDLSAYGGDAPERDETEFALVTAAIRRRLPLLGVCRGMQTLQHYFDIPLIRVNGHTGGPQQLVIDDKVRRVNSYHRWGTTLTRPPLTAWAVAPDGTVKAVRHDTLPIVGIMWHPERLVPFAEDDRRLFRTHFEVVAP